MLIVIPYIDNLDQTGQTLTDALAQQDVGDVRVLLIDQGSSEEGSRWGDAQQLQHEEGHRVLCWHYHPQLSLGAAWNQAMAFAEESGEAGAFIINNDIRLLPHMASVLVEIATARAAYFISGVGVDEEQWIDGSHVTSEGLMQDRGGPDFSCYYFTLEGWHAYHYDELFWPAFTEDVDMHRRMLLGGDGEKIFGVNLPFRHFASGTINQSSAHRQRLTRLFGESYKYFETKWGGKPNEETFWAPFGKYPGPEDWTPRTPGLFEFVQTGRYAELQQRLSDAGLTSAKFLKPDGPMPDPPEHP